MVLTSPGHSDAAVAEDRGSESGQLERLGAVGVGLVGGFLSGSRVGREVGVGDRVDGSEPGCWSFVSVELTVDGAGRGILMPRL